MWIQHRRFGAELCLCITYRCKSQVRCHGVVTTETYKTMYICPVVPTFWRRMASVVLRFGRCQGNILSAKAFSWGIRSEDPCRSLEFFWLCHYLFIGFLKYEQGQSRKTWSNGMYSLSAYTWEQSEVSWLCTLHWDESEFLKLRFTLSGMLKMRDCNCVIS